MGRRRVLALAMLVSVASVVAAAKASEPTSTGPTCSGLRALFGEDLVACSDAAEIPAALGLPRVVRPLLAGIRVNASVPFKDAVPSLIQLYRYNTGTRFKIATQEWLQAFPDQTLPNYSEVASAVGCNQDVCIYVKGEGLIVDEWWTSAWAYYEDGWVCPDVYWRVDYDPGGSGYPYDWDWFFNYNGPCSRAAKPGDRVFWYGYSNRVPASFNHGTRLCNKWTGEYPGQLAGFPCITVHR